MSSVTERNPGAVGWALTSLGGPQDLAVFPFSWVFGKLSGVFSRGLAVEGEYKGAIKKCQAMVNKSYSVRSQEVPDHWQ